MGLCFYITALAMWRVVFSCKRRVNIGLKAVRRLLHDSTKCHLAIKIVSKTSWYHTGGWGELKCAAIGLVFVMIIVSA